MRKNSKVAVKTKSVYSDEILAKIQKRAYELFLKRGGCHGSDWNDWFEAERQIRREMGLR